MCSDRTRWYYSLKIDLNFVRYTFLVDVDWFYDERFRIRVLQSNLNILAIVLMQAKETLLKLRNKDLCSLEDCSEGF